MIVHGLKMILDFSKEHREYKKPLKRWLNIAQRVECRKYAVIKSIFSSADWITVNDWDYVVFNIIGNKVRLVANVNLKLRPPALFIVCVLTHAEYSKEKWKKGL